MGWKADAALLFMALLAASLSVWVVALPLLVLAAVKVGGGRRKKPAAVPEPGGGRVSRRLLLSASLAALGAAAVASGGRFSAVLLFTGAFLVAAWGRLPLGQWSSAVEPLPGSVLLRGRWAPWRWSAVAEVKLASSDLARALSGLEGEVILDLVASRVYLRCEVVAVAASWAEGVLLSRMKRANRLAARSGAYLLPLDSEEAAGFLGATGERVKVDASEPAASVKALPLDVVVVSVRGGLARAVGAYLKEDGAGARFLPGQRLAFRMPFWEILAAAKGKTEWRRGDEFASFLASVWAARREHPGELIQAEEGDGGSVTVSAHASARVSLSKPQLRAVLMINGQGSGAESL